MDCKARTGCQRSQKIFEVSDLVELSWFSERLSSYNGVTARNPYRCVEHYLVRGMIDGTLCMKKGIERMDGRRIYELKM